jgi:hypothetical protein
VADEGNYLFAFRAEIGNQMLYSKSVFTNSKPIPRKTQPGKKKKRQRKFPSDQSFLHQIKSFLHTLSVRLTVRIFLLEAARSGRPCVSVSPRFPDFTLTYAEFGL